MDVISNRIQSAHSGYVKLLRGTLSDRLLTRISPTKAQQTFKQKFLTYTVNNSMTATIANGKITVTITP